MSSENNPQVPFPWSAYLSQPVFHPKYKLILNPVTFARKYQVRLLESCLRKQFPPLRYRRTSGGY